MTGSLSYMELNYIFLMCNITQERRVISSIQLTQQDALELADPFVNHTFESLTWLHTYPLTFPMS